MKPKIFELLNNIKKLIKQENEEATETNVYSAKAIDKMNARNIAVAYNNEAQNINSEYVTYTLTDADLIGDKLKFVTEKNANGEIVNGKIVIGKNIKKVKVNASVFMENMQSNNISYIWLQIFQNGHAKCGSIASGVPVWFQTLIISDCILDVKENDYIELNINNANYTTHIPTVRGGKENTRLYVEVIE